MAAVRGSGCTAAAPAGREPHLAPQPRDAPARMPQPFPAQLGVDAWRAVDPPAGGEDAADLLAQLGFRLGTALDGGGLSGISCGVGHDGSEGAHPCRDAKNLTSRMPCSISCWPAPIRELPWRPMGCLTI